MRVWFERGIVFRGEERLLGCLVRGLVEWWDDSIDGSIYLKKPLSGCLLL